MGETYGKDGPGVSIEVREVHIELILRGRVVEIKKPLDMLKRTLDDITLHPYKTTKGKATISLKKAPLKLTSGRHRKVPLPQVIGS